MFLGQKKVNIVIVFLSLQKLSLLLLTFDLTADPTNHSLIAVSVVFLIIFLRGDVFMPDLADFFDQKVSKVTLIFAFIITIVLSEVVIFHCLKVTTLLGGVATSYKVVFQLLSKNFGGLWLGQKKVNMLCYEFYSIERKAFQRRRKKKSIR